MRSVLGGELLACGGDRGGNVATARSPRRPACGRDFDFLSRGVCWRGVCFACARFCGGREAGSVWAGGGASVAGPRGRLALPRALPSAFQTQSAFGRNRALSGRARRAKLWVWTLSTCGATIAAIFPRAPAAAQSVRCGAAGSLDFQNGSLVCERALALRRRDAKTTQRC